MLLKRIFYYLTDEKNYPIYVHCNAGADRTGTVAFLINGLLGVSFEDLTRDFELTSTYSARWRSAGEDAFEGTGVNASGTYLPGGTGNYVSFGELYDAMMEFSEDGTLKNGIENFLIEKVEIQES
ncbi:MAG: tyrosine-protein phosphatase, partial [Clostridia bacterium]|nr:tyrosine-protein phosphatase [Clostridia bacterium]